MPELNQPGYGHESDDWIARFGHMAVAGSPPTRPARRGSSDGGFVGGFVNHRANKPLPAMPVDRAWESPPLTSYAAFEPIARMPEPRNQSRTMQHALAGTPAVPWALRPGAPASADRSHSAPAEESPASLISIASLPNPNSPPTTPTSAARRKQGALRPPAAPLSATRVHSDPGAASPARKTPQRKTKAKAGRAVSLTPSSTASSEDSDSPPSSPAVSTPGRTSGGDKVPCAGQTVKGLPCKRTVKIAADDDVEVARLCHQHAKTFGEQTIFYARGNGQQVTFSDWIPDYVSESTRNALKMEMEKSAARGEEDGYIYTFQISDPQTPDLVHLKVGRTVNLTQRMHQWSRQCMSREQVLRGFWPGTVQPAAPGESDDAATLLRGRVQAGPPGKASHRLERLVHLELADLAANAPYLDAAWPKAPAAAKNSTPKKAVKARCSDCGTMHKEIFSFPRVKSGRYKGKEWELLVQPVISKWGSFVEAYL